MLRGRAKSRMADDAIQPLRGRRDAAAGFEIHRCYNFVWTRELRCAKDWPFHDRAPSSGVVSILDGEGAS